MNVQDVVGVIRHAVSGSAAPKAAEPRATPRAEPEDVVETSDAAAQQEAARDEAPSESNAAPSIDPPKSMMTHRVELRIDHSTDLVFGVVVDRESGEVVAQFPPEDAIKWMHYAREDFKRLIDRQA